jgi:hypothetical protein
VFQAFSLYPNRIDTMLAQISNPREKSNSVTNPLKVPEATQLGPSGTTEQGAKSPELLPSSHAGKSFPSATREPHQAPLLIADCAQASLKRGTVGQPPPNCLQTASSCDHIVRPEGQHGLLFG